MFDTASLLAALLALTGSGARDFDYARLSVLLPESDHVVIARVEALAPRGAEVTVSEVLRGSLRPGRVLIQQGEDAFADACMGATSWKVGERQVLFLRRSRDDTRLEVAFEGAGQHPLPMLGVFDLPLLREVLVAGTIDAARIVEVISTLGAHAATVVRDQCSEIGVTVDFDQPVIQQALVDVLVGMPAITEARRWDAIAAASTLTPAHLAALPPAVRERLEGAGRRATQLWEAVSFLAPLARAGITSAQERLAQAVAGEVRGLERGVFDRGWIRYVFEGHAALIAGGVKDAETTARRAFAELESDDPYLRAVALDAWLDADPEHVEREIVRRTRARWKQEDVWFPLLLRGRGLEARRLVDALLADPTFQASRYEDEVRRAHQRAPLPFTEEFRAGVAQRLQQPSATVDALTAWLRLHALAGGDAEPARRETLRWLRKDGVSHWNRIWLLRTLGDLEGRPLLPRALPSDAELDAATDALAQRIASAK